VTSTVSTVTSIEVPNNDDNNDDGDNDDDDDDNDYFDDVYLRFTTWKRIS
jgi:hypothetical protein